VAAAWLLFCVFLAICKSCAFAYNDHAAQQVTLQLLFHNVTGGVAAISGDCWLRGG
jgi:hypothetical protein